MTHDHPQIDPHCPVCAQVLALLAERYGPPVRSAWRDPAGSVAQRLTELADLPHDPEDPT
jgi:hypothetical protein